MTARGLSAVPMGTAGFRLPTFSSVAAIWESLVVACNHGKLQDFAGGTLRDPLLVPRCIGLGEDGFDCSLSALHPFGEGGGGKTGGPGGVGDLSHSGEDTWPSGTVELPCPVELAQE